MPQTPSLADLMARRIRQDVQSIQAYAIQDSQGMVKLDAMENPHRLAPELQAALGQRLGAAAINRYPDARVADVRHALADYAHMPAGCALMLGNGSDELISLLAMACDVASDPLTGARPVVLAPVPGFVMYAMSAQLQGLDFVGVPLTADFALDTSAMLAAIAQHQPALVFLAYPNNPTANLWDAQAMDAVVTAAGEAGSLVVVDEAYQPFSSRSYLDRMAAEPQRHAHVLLLRTLSKFGLAGVRIGYLMGRSELIAQIDKLRPPYNISVLNAECALFALGHAEVFAAQAEDIKAQRSRLLKAFAAMPGLQAFPSDANMILLRLHGDGRATAVFEALKSQGILVK
ncbi:MAG: histidinol-phosphate transaminase, partial [Rhodoferax sp.]|nr:histidinol-phosphate transaminase [Rhodoferax sp.]